MLLSRVSSYSQARVLCVGAESYLPSFSRPCGGEIDGSLRIENQQ
jgi:hypothetical protein